MPAYGKNLSRRRRLPWLRFLKLCILEDKLQRAMPLATSLWVRTKSTAGRTKIEIDSCRSRSFRAAPLGISGLAHGGSASRSSPVPARMDFHSLSSAGAIQLEGQQLLSRPGFGLDGVGIAARGYDHSLLTVHMVKHLLLMTFAPPLILLGEPMRVSGTGCHCSPERVRPRREASTHRAICANRHKFHR